MREVSFVFSLCLFLCMIIAFVAFVESYIPHGPLRLVVVICLFVGSCTDAYI